MTRRLKLGGRALLLGALFALLATGQRAGRLLSTLLEPGKQTVDVVEACLPVASQAHRGE
jgi:hypothetical protein